MLAKFLRMLSQNRTLIFLVMCLFVHIFNAIYFYSIGLTPLVVLNIGSSCLYVLFLTLFKKNSDLQIVFAYFEIIIFSFLSEVVAGGHFSYVNFIIGMVAVVFFLLPFRNKKKHIYQFIGAVSAIGVSQITVFEYSMFPEYLPIVLEHKVFISCLNLIITLFTLFYVSNLYLVELNEARAKLDYSSNHDVLTGLYNRRFFEGIMKRSKEENENAFSVAMVDVDDFKHINDTYGHEAGDKVLERVSHLLADVLPKNAIAVRWGGEEFVLYLPMMSVDSARGVLENFITRLRECSVIYRNQEIRISATIGVCTGDSISEYENYIRQADEKLYWGKKHGKNQIVS